MKFKSVCIPYSGIPLGGVGAGSIEIRANGRLHEWMIFNNKPWSGYGSPEFPIDARDFIFAIRVKAEDEEPVVRILQTDLWDKDVDITYGTFSTIINPYQMPWIRHVEKIILDGRPPFAFLKYEDSAFDKLGLEVSLKAFSPMIPGDVKNSSIPVAVFKFNLRNISNKKLQVSLLVLMKNPHGVNENVRLKNRVLEKENYTVLLMESDGLNEKHGMYRGSLALAFPGQATATADIVLKRDDKRAKAHKLRRILVDFRDDGCLQGGDESSTIGGELYGGLAKKIEIGPGERIDIVFVLAWFYPNHLDSTGKRIGHYYENFFQSPVDVVEYVLENIDYLYGKTKKFKDALYDACYEEWLSDLAASQVTTLIKSTWLTRDGVFGVWEGGPGCCGLNTVDVMLWAITGVALLYPELAKNIVEQISKLILRPGLTPYYEIFALAFPENMALYREALKKDPSIQHDVEKFRRVLREIIEKTGKDPVGRVPHTFMASFDVINGYDRSDLMLEYILITLLNYCWTGDLDYLKPLWNTVKDVIDAVLRQHDDAGLKLPYHSPPSGYEGFSQIARILAKNERHEWMLKLLLSGPMYVPTTVNTFDALSLIGIATFTSDLWVAALKVTMTIAEKLEGNYVKKLEKIYRDAVSNFVKYLWNGEYFDLWYDPLTGCRDKACMSAALTGEWYLKVLLGLDYAIDREKMLSTLKAIHKYNFKIWEGLLNATYPGKPRPALKGDMKYFNEVGIPYAIGGQMDTPWTGIEIPVATHMIWEGMIEEGLKILNSVHERYISWGFYWNHIECHGHYMRVLCSLLIPNALAGARYFGITKSLELNPRICQESFRGPILAPGALLACEYKINKEKLTVHLKTELGRLTLRELVFPALKKASRMSLKLNGTKKTCGYSCEDFGVKVSFETMEMVEGDELFVEILLK